MKNYETSNMMAFGPDRLAAEITLIDLPIFKSIRREELTSLGDYNHSRPISRESVKVKSKSSRLSSSPNVVAMNRQFNLITFWVVGQILSHNSARTRAHVISHSIKIAKQLYLLNNIHSSYAIVSALLSSSIYRLEKTWDQVRRKHPKEEQQFEQLRELFSDNNNYQLLRNHIANCQLPCIPYMGIISRDIIYTKEANPEGSSQRTKNLSKILESIEKFQLGSDYNHLIGIQGLNYCCCLFSSSYKDELQKSVEDKNYSRSLFLEPANNSIMLNASDHHLDLLNNDINQTITNKDNVTSPNKYNHKKLITTLVTLLQSALLTNGNKFGSGSARKLNHQDNQEAKENEHSEFGKNHEEERDKYVIDNNFIDTSDNPQTTMVPPPISSSN